MRTPTARHPPESFKAPSTQPRPGRPATIRTSATFAVCLALLASALAGFAAFAEAAERAPPEDGPHVTDPEGDAYEYPATRPTQRAADACRASSLIAYECRSLPVHNAGRGILPGAVAAPPALDIVAAWFDETPTALRVTIEVAALDEALSGMALDADHPEGPKFGSLVVQWRVGSGGCTEVLQFDVFPNGRRHAVLEQSDASCVAGPSAEPDHPWDGGCNYYWWCEVEVPYELRYGSPGAVIFSVPRDVLLAGDEGATLDAPRASTWRSDAPGERVRYGVGATGVGGSNGVVQPTAESYALDSTDAGRAFTFETPRAPLPFSAPSAGPHAVRPSDPGLDPRIDVLALDVEETSATITLTTTLTQVDTEPGDIWHWTAFALPAGHVVVVNTGRGEEGGYVTHAAYLVPREPALVGAGGYVLVVPAILEVKPGSPGSVSVTLSRSDLPPIHEGEVSTLLVTFVADAVDDVWLYPRAPGVAGAYVETYAGHPSSYTRGTPPYRFLHDTPVTAYEGILRVADAVGDTRSPDVPFLESGVADRFDITYLEARAQTSDEVHFTMGLRDLSRATVPSGYEGMFYAMAAQVEDRTTMIGYYKQQGVARGDFLCAPDITVLTERQRDPTEAVWTIINGIVTQPPGGASGAGGPGAITFHVPATCFGDATLPLLDGDVAFDRLAAGTFLVRAATGGVGAASVHEMDGAEADGSVRLAIQRAALAPAQAPWYDAPFGIEAFWDILGIGFAVAIAAGATGYKLRRRSLDKKALADAKAREDRDVYRVALARAVASSDGRDPERDEVLQALRRRLGISEREHAILELAARAEAGAGFTGPAAGTRFLGKYRIEKVLGEGGFARTFLARDETLARRVVLKLARWPSPKETRRALHEARILARMDHANIVKVHDADLIADQLVLVLEHVPAGSLADAIAKKPLALSEAVRVTDDILAALEGAHAAGVVHRDVKPANILLARDGAAKLADFGIAQAAAGTGTVGGEGTLAGRGAGTLRYMAPEQARGEEATAASDVYAVGAVLHEALTGRSYLSLDGLAEFEARAAITSEPPRLPAPGVPDGVNALLSRLLAKDPAARPASAAEARGLLAAAAVTGAVVRRPPAAEARV